MPPTYTMFGFLSKLKPKISVTATLFTRQLLQPFVLIFPIFDFVTGCHFFALLVGVVRKSETEK